MKNVFMFFLFILFIFSACNNSSTGSNAENSGSENGNGSTTQSVTYSIIYDGSECDSGEVPIDNNSYEEDEQVIILGNTGNLIKDGYTFGGWNTEPDYTGTTYTGDMSFRIGSADITLYAFWVEKYYEGPYTVTYDGNEKTSGTVPVDNDIYYEGDPVTVSGITDLIRTGYLFVGWNTKADGTGVTHVENEIFYMGEADITLYAKWKKRGMVTYVKNNATSGSVPEDKNIYYENEIITVLGNTGELARNGVKGEIHFSGWNTSTDGHGTTYIEGDTIVMGKENIILYAKWDYWTMLEEYTGATTTGIYICTDSDGNFYISGETTTDLNSELLSGTQDAFVTKYNKALVWQWTRLAGAAESSTSGNGILCDSAGNIYVTGGTTGDIDGEGDQALTGTTDAYLIKYDTNGNRLWIRQFGVAEAGTAGAHMCFDSADNKIYISGGTNGNLFDETLNGISDAFIVRYDSDGNRDLIKLAGESGKTYTENGICVDSAGNYYLAGQSATQAIFVNKYNKTSGEMEWTTTNLGAIGSSGGICVDSSDNIFVTGSYVGLVTGGEIIGGENNKTMYVIKYGADGTQQWAKQIGGQHNGFCYPFSICADSAGNIYSLGYATQGLYGISTEDSDGNYWYHPYVVSFDTDGTVRWLKLLGDSGYNTYSRGGMCIGSNNILLTTGYTTGDLEGQVNSGATDMFISAYFSEME